MYEQSMRSMSYRWHNVNGEWESLNWRTFCIATVVGYAVFFVGWILTNYLVAGRWNHRIYEGVVCAIGGLIVTISWRCFRSTKSPHSASARKASLRRKTEPSDDFPEYCDLAALAKWVGNKRVSLPAVDHEDGDSVIATVFSYEDLLLMLQVPNAVPSRRDSILCALVLELECLLDPNDPNESYDESTANVALAELTQFAKDNWQEILRIDREMGLGFDFNRFVVPHITGT